MGRGRVASSPGVLQESFSGDLCGPELIPKVYTELSLALLMPQSLQVCTSNSSAALALLCVLAGCMF